MFGSEGQYDIFGNLIENQEEEFKTVKRELKELKDIIRYHADLYYNQDRPEISDYEYDKLMQRLKGLEEKYPSLITKESPTQKVIGKSKEIFKRVEHEIPMQSLQDVFSYEEVEAYIEKITSEYGKEIEFIVENKIDGLSISLEYVNGQFMRGSTRGDGIIGEEVTDNLKTLKEVPEKLKDNVTIELRGEVYFSNKQFEILNQIQEEHGKPLFANPRNAAAGTLRQISSELVKERNLSVFIFNVQKAENGLIFKTHSESLEFCKKQGLHVVDYSKVCKRKRTSYKCY
ncbi:MAG: hypothetical protein PHR25_01450 [Clostridia bacterium]|nr:hypothetical protein [Clostridia bacterium]MDD4375430.1 hypothetical protein [Clostridia bacterium]